MLENAEREIQERLNGQEQGGEGGSDVYPAVGMRAMPGWWASAKLLEAHSSTAAKMTANHHRATHNPLTNCPAGSNGIFGRGDWTEDSGMVN